MKQSEIIRMQQKIGAVPDGFWGPKSIASCQRYLKALMPRDNPFPKQGSNAFEAYYGPHGVKDGYTPPMKQIVLPFPIYYEGKKVTKISAHEKCAGSLLAVFQRLAAAYPTEAARSEAGISDYAGIYNPRPMRGTSSTWSMHAWAIAIDLDAGRNGNLVSWPAKAVMPLEVMECFAKEGWLSAGAFWGRDAMHFQATSF